jgi:hypothetical protein
MGDALPTINPPLEFRPPPPTRPIQIRPPNGPVPTQARRGYDRPPHPHHNDHNHEPNPTSTSKALIIRDPSSHLSSGFEQGQPSFRPSLNHHNQTTSPSTTFHIGPIPPIFTIEQIHMAIRSLNPKIALFDIRLGTIEIEIPFTLTWQQIGDCESFPSYLASYLLLLLIYSFSFSLFIGRFETCVKEIADKIGCRRGIKIGMFS